MPSTIIITGANGNLGVAVVKRFLAEGYHVIAIDRHFNNLAFATGKENFEEHTIDLLSETASAAYIADVVSRRGVIHAALFLVGGFAMGNLESTTIESIQQMVTLNFETAFNMSKFVFNVMIRQQFGRIVFVGARPALDSKQAKNVVGYALSKSLLFRLAEVMNEEAKDKNVVTSVIVPSTIDTPENRASMPDAGIGNWVKPDDIADILAFICDSKSMVLREPIYKIYNNA